jgi:hypothetical protein
MATSTPTGWHRRPAGGFGGGAAPVAMSGARCSARERAGTVAPNAAGSRRSDGECRFRAAVARGSAPRLHPTRNGDLDAFPLARWSVQPVWWRCGRWSTNGGSPRRSVRAVPGAARGDQSSASGRSPFCVPAWPLSCTRPQRRPRSVCARSARRSKVWWRCRYCGRVQVPTVGRARRSQRHPLGFRPPRIIRLAERTAKRHLTRPTPRSSAQGACSCIHGVALDGLAHDREVRPRRLPG